MKTLTARKNTVSAEAATVLARLDERMFEVMSDIEQSAMWRVLTDPQTDPAMLRALMREIYLEIWTYQPHITEAMMSIIARIPKTQPKLIRMMLLHTVDEADHGEMALRDHVRLGGDEQAARAALPSPAAFAVAAFWWGMCRMSNPLAYLGAVYTLEAMTPLVCARVIEALRGRGFPDEALEFIAFHAEEDIKHAHLVRHMVKEAIEAFPGCGPTILHGMECWFSVYPGPLWDTALVRAQASLRQSNAA